MRSTTLTLLHEDDDLLVVDKPQGLVCHPSKAGPESSLIGRVRLYLGHGEGRLVNRLDRETGGIVIIAKHREAASALGRLFATDAVSKTYLAVVHGALDGEERVIDAPLGKDVGSAVVIKDCVRPDGAAARTRLRPVGPVPGPDGRFTLVEVRPETGRKHQIRIHLAYIGHPIVGDKLYGDDELRYLRFVVGALTEEDRASLVLPYHALHAASLAFQWRGRPWEWHAATPAGLDDLIAGHVPGSVS